MINKAFCHLMRKTIQEDRFLEGYPQKFEYWIPITVVLFIVSEFDEFPESCREEALKVLKSITQEIKDKHDEDVQEVYKLALKNLNKKPNKKQKKQKKILVQENVKNILNSVQGLSSNDFKLFLKKIEKRYNLEITPKPPKEIIEDNSIQVVIQRVINQPSKLLKYGVKKEEFIKFMINFTLELQNEKNSLIRSQVLEENKQ